MWSIRALRRSLRSTRAAGPALAPAAVPALAAALAVAAAVRVPPLAAQEATGAAPASSTAAPGADVAIYPGGPALVREDLALSLPDGPGTVTWDSPPDGLDFTSLSLTFPGLSGADVLGQRRLQGSAGLEGLLRASTGGPVTLALADGDTLRGTLVSSSGGLLVREAGGRVAALSPGQVRALLLPDLPAGWREGPAVSWSVRSPHAGPARGRVRYLTGGVSWSAEYALTLAPDDRSLGLEGWADLHDGTGRSWPEARVRLVAGELNRASPPSAAPMAARAKAALEYAGGASDQAVQRSFSEYHVFELPRPVSLTDGQTARALLLRASDVPTRKLYLFRGGESYPYGSSRPLTQADVGGGGETNVTAALELASGKDAPIAKPLPAGRARIYERDEDGTELLAGEADV
ncbi:MAG TPA: DUF4139 domain-containing protein, partial [Gemmatimonadota bacterium]|nr:DUF4139 domain-containing protein [Gemmatimonadota bacterium]